MASPAILWASTMSSDPRVGGGGRFPETSWSLFQRLGPLGDGRAALDDLAERYWKPIHGYLRAVLGRSSEDAQDLTQAFFAWLLEQEPLDRYDPARGSFRAYLKALLRRFVGHEDRALRRWKRGGRVRHLPLESVDPPTDRSGEDLDRAFDRAWAGEVVGRALAELESRATAVGRPEALAVYRRFDLAPRDERPSYDALAAELGVPWGTVKNHLCWAREQVRRSIDDELARTTIDAAGAAAEWNDLFRRS